MLHTDERLLPRSRAARASWNYDADDATRPTVTYYLNRLQRLDTDVPYCVTLNRSDAIDPSRVILRTVTDHPLFTPETLTGQQALSAVSGERRTAYAGAHLGNGFHEDGLASGVRAARGAGGALVRSGIYSGMLVHCRREPVRNTFRYPLSFFVLDLDELPTLERELKLFSVNRRNAVTLRDKDHFDGTRPVKEAVVHFCAERGVEVDRVLMLAPAPRRGLRVQPGHLLLVLRPGRRARRRRRRAEQHLRRAPARAPARARPGIRPREAPARLTVLRPRPVVRIRLLGAGRRSVGAHPRPRRRPPAIDRRAARPPQRADQRQPRALPRPLSADAGAGDRHSSTGRRSSSSRSGFRSITSRRTSPASGR